MITLKMIESWKNHRVKNSKQTPAEILKELKITPEDFELIIQYHDKDIKDCPSCKLTIMARSPKTWDTTYQCIRCPFAER